MIALNNTKKAKTCTIQSEFAFWKYRITTENPALMLLHAINI